MSHRQEKRALQKKVEHGLMDGAPFLGLIWMIFKGIRATMKSRK